MQELKTILENGFGTKVTTQNNTLKLHLSKLQGREIVILNDLYLSDSLKIESLEVKRSGTGLTIIITLKP